MYIYIYMIPYMYTMEGNKFINNFPISCAYLQIMIMSCIIIMPFIIYCKNVIYRVRETPLSYLNISTAILWITYFLKLRMFNLLNRGEVSSR